MDTKRADTERNRFARSLFHGLPPRYDTLAYLLSFGQDRRWRAAVVSHIVAAQPKSVLDVACGPAGVTLAIADSADADAAHHASLDGRSLDWKGHFARFDTGAKP